MRAVLVYESMFGCTKAVATAIADGMIGSGLQVDVMRASDGCSSLLTGADLVVVGCPTHARGLPNPSTRLSAPTYAAKLAGRVQVEPDADRATGVREWLAAQDHLIVKAAAFDTRRRGPALLTGRAAKRVDRALDQRGATLIARPESFITVANHLVKGEIDRARVWGEELAALLGVGSTD